MGRMGVMSVMKSLNADVGKLQLTGQPPVFMNTVYWHTATPTACFPTAAAARSTDSRNRMTRNIYCLTLFQNSSLTRHLRKCLFIHISSL